MKKSGEHLPLYPDEETIAIEIMGARRAKDWLEKALYLEGKHGLPRVDEFMGGRFGRLWSSFSAHATGWGFVKDLTRRRVIFLH